jgi:hypothetical protein
MSRKPHTPAPQGPARPPTPTCTQNASPTRSTV